MPDFAIPARQGRRRRGLLTHLARIRMLRRQRQALANLDAHLLQDVGLTREEADREARRIAWDAPDWWR